MEDLEKVVRDLRRDVDTQQQTSVAAESLRDAARAGRDIEPALDALEDALHRGTGYGVFAPAAEALARHLIRTAQGDRLREAFDKCEGSDQLSTALRDLAREGVDLASVVPALLAPLRNLALVDVLGAWIDRDPSRLQGVLAPLAEANPPTFFRLLETRWWSQFRQQDVSLRDLAPLLKDDDVATRRRGAAIAQQAAADVDLLELADPLESMLEDQDDDVRKWAANALATTALRNSLIEVLARLQNHRREDVRLEATRAACADAIRRREGFRIDDVLVGIVDGSKAVREVALQCLRDLERDNRPITVGESWRARVAAAEQTREVVEALAILGIGHERDGGPAALEDVPCLVCLALPRAGGWTSLSSVPSEYEELVDVGGGLAKCPECGNVYRREYEEEYDDMDHWESWSLTRLSPTEARRIDGEPGRWWNEHYVEQIEQYERRLTHPRARLREDAGWALAHHYVAEEDWSALRDLVHFADVDAARVAAAAVERAEAGGAKVRATVFNGPREDLPPIVRMRARGNLPAKPEAVLRTLGTEEPEALQAALSELDSAHREGLEIDPYLDRVLELAGHDAREVREIAGWIVTRLDDPGQLERTVARGVALLNASAPAVREAGCRILRGLAAKSAETQWQPTRDTGWQAQIQKVVPRLVAAFADPATHWEANHALQALSRAGADVAIVVPAVVDKVCGPPVSQWAIDLELLEVLRERGHDVSATAPAIFEIVSNGSGNLRFLAHKLLCRFLEANVLSPETLRAVEVALPRLYGADSLSRPLAQIRIREGDWDTVNSMLGSSMTVAWSTIDALRNVVDEGGDISAATDALRALVANHPGVVGEHAARLLLAARVTRPEELERRVKEFRDELYSYEAWDHDFIPNPHSPYEALSKLTELGPEVIPTLCQMVRDGDREVRYWAIIGLKEFGPSAGAEALAALETVLDDSYVARSAAEAIAFVDESRFFQLGLHANHSAVGDVTRTHHRRGTAAGWLQRVFWVGDEGASTAAIEGLPDIDAPDIELLLVLREALRSPYAKVQSRAIWLLGRLPGATSVESLIRAMVSSGYVAVVDRVAWHPDSIELVDVLVKREWVAFLADLVFRRRCAGLETPPELAREFVERKLRDPKREWRYEEHDVHDAAKCALELGDDALLPALVDAVIPANGGYAWNALVQALAFFAPRAIERLEARQLEVDAPTAERIGWMLKQLRSIRRPELEWADAQFVRGDIDHTTGGAFETYGRVLRDRPSAHAAFQLAWIDRAFGVPITPERVSWIALLGCEDEALLTELTTPVTPLNGLRFTWRSCKPHDVEGVLAAGLPGLAHTGSRDPQHEAMAQAHVDRVRRACRT